LSADFHVMPVRVQRSCRRVFVGAQPFNFPINLSARHDVAPVTVRMPDAIGNQRIDMAVAVLLVSLNIRLLLRSHHARLLILKQRTYHGAHSSGAADVRIRFGYVGSTLNRCHDVAAR
jgi:hypothetical protein